MAGLHMTSQTRVLILCTGNSARSQMAEGLLRHMVGEQVEVVSAGVAPTQVRREAIDAMREIGIDISSQRSKSVDEFAGHHFDYVVTVCDNANQQCPMFSGKSERIHWSIEDPAEVDGDADIKLTAFRRARDILQERLRNWISKTNLLNPA